MRFFSASIVFLFLGICEAETIHCHTPLTIDGVYKVLFKSKKSSFEYLDFFQIEKCLLDHDSGETLCQIILKSENETYYYLVDESKETPLGTYASSIEGQPSASLSLYKELPHSHYEGTLTLFFGAGRMNVQMVTCEKPLLTIPN